MIVVIVTWFLTTFRKSDLEKLRRWFWTKRQL